MASRRKITAGSGGTVQSLDRGLSILRALAARDGLTLSELADATRLAPSTVHRLLGTLDAQRFVAFDGASGRWRVGVEAFAIGHSFLRTRRVADAGGREMRALRESTGETATLSIPDDLDMVYVAQAESHSPMRAFFRPGQRAPLFCSAAGKAVLAALAPDDRARRLARLRPIALTPRTLVAPGALAGDIEATLLRGFALDDEEHTPGMRCVGAAIRDESGEPVAALSVSGPTTRAPRERIADLGRRVRDAAAAISAEIGGRAS